MARGNVRAAIKASAKARKAAKGSKVETCWGGLMNETCKAPCGALADAEGYPACEAHGGKLYPAEVLNRS